MPKTRKKRPKYSMSDIVFCLNDCDERIKRAERNLNLLSDRVSSLCEAILKLLKATESSTGEIHGNTSRKRQGKVPVLRT